MRTFGSPFSLCLFDPSDASSPDFDKALRIFRANTSPLLATRSNQIRVKAASPIEGDSTFFFAGLIHSKTVIGFAMFGHYPSSRLVVFDHLVVDRQHRGENAFYNFAQLLKQAVDKLRLEFDFAVVEVEKGGHEDGSQTGGLSLARLLGQINFDEVHANYRIADLEPGHAPDGHAGILMLRCAVKIHRLSKADLAAIHAGVLFDHYLPWCSSFLGDRTPAYRRELERLHATFIATLPDEIAVNGAMADGLLPAGDDQARAWGADMRHVLGYMAMLAAATAMAWALKITPSETAMLLVVILAAYAGVDLVRSGRADVVFEKAIARLIGGTRRSPSPPALPRRGTARSTSPAVRGGSRGARRP